MSATEAMPVNRILPRLPGLSNGRSDASITPVERAQQRAQKYEYPAANREAKKANPAPLMARSVPLAQLPAELLPRLARRMLFQPGDRRPGS